MAVGSWFEFQQSPLPVVKFIGISSGVKAVLFTALALLLYLPWQPLVYLLGNRPFYFANALTILLLAFAVGAPTLVYLNNRPYDLIGDSTLAVLYYGYIPVCLALWVALIIAVVVVWTGADDVGRRPGLWILALVLAPIICICAWSSRILH